MQVKMKKHWCLPSTYRTVNTYNGMLGVVFKEKDGSWTCQIMCVKAGHIQDEDSGFPTKRAAVTMLETAFEDFQPFSCCGVK